MLMGILLLLVLFILGGFINTLFYIPPKKLMAYVQSFLPTCANFSSCSNMSIKTMPAPAPPPPPPPTEEKEKEKDKERKTTRELEKVFSTFDKNGDGFITMEELKESLKSIGLFSSDKEVETMIARLDKNGDGLIDMDEFYEMYECMERTSDDVGEEDRVVKEEEEEGELREAFDVFDGDKDGLISVEELDSVLSCLGLKQAAGMRIEDCKEMINQVDMDGDGMVSFDEFKQMMKGGGGGGALISLS